MTVEAKAYRKQIQELINDIQKKDSRYTVMSISKTIFENRLRLANVLKKDDYPAPKVARLTIKKLTELLASMKDYSNFSDEMLMKTVRNLMVSKGYNQSQLNKSMGKSSSYAHAIFKSKNRNGMLTMYDFLIVAPKFTKESSAPSKAFKPGKRKAKNISASRKEPELMAADKTNVVVTVKPDAADRKVLEDNSEVIYSNIADNFISYPEKVEKETTTPVIETETIDVPKIYDITVDGHHFYLTKEENGDFGFTTDITKAEKFTGKEDVSVNLDEKYGKQKIVWDFE